MSGESYRNIYNYLGETYKFVSFLIYYFWVLTFQVYLSSNRIKTKLKNKGDIFKGGLLHNCLET